MRISDWSSDVCSSDLAALQQSRKGPETDAGEIADAVFRVGVIFRRMPERLVLLCQKFLPFTQTLEPYDSRGHSFRPPISLDSIPIPRSKERRVGTECVSKCRSRWWQYS